MVAGTLRRRWRLIGIGLPCLLWTLVSAAQPATAPVCSVPDAELQQITPIAVRLPATEAALLDLDVRLNDLVQRLGPDHLDVADVLLQKARLLASIGRRLPARQALEGALAIQRQGLGEFHLRVAATRQALGNVLRDMGEARLAMEMLAEAVANYQRAGRGRSTAAGRALADLASAHLEAGYAYSSHRMAERARVILEAGGPGNDAALAMLLNLQGVLASTFRDFEGAIRLHERALSIASASGAAAYFEKISAFTGLGHAFTGQARHAQAIECQASALAIVRHAIGARSRAVVRALLNLANASLAAGDFPTAKRRAEEALAIVDGPAALDSASTIFALRSLGHLHAALNDRLMARQLYARALQIREREFGSDNGVAAQIQIELAGTMQAPDELDEALSLNRRALAFSRSRIPDYWKIGLMLNNIGVIHARQGRLSDARESFEQALRHFQRVLDPSDIEVARTLTLLGGVSLRAEGPEKAISHLHEAMAIVSARGFVAMEAWPTLHQYSQALRALQERGAAIFFAKQAVNAIQAIRTGAANLDEGLQQSFLVDKAVVYRDLADALIEEGRLSEALEVLRLLKEDEYFDFMQRDGRRDGRETRLALTEGEQRVDETLRASDASTAQVIRELDQLGRKAGQNARLTPAEQARRAELQDHLATGRARFREFLAQLPKTLRTPVRELRAINEGQLDALRQLLRHRPGTGIVHYVMGPERLSIILTLPGANLPFQRPVSDVALHRRIVEFRQAIQARRNASAAAQALFDDLIRPIEKELSEANIDTLLLSLDGALRYVPFAALHDGSRYLVERFAIGLLTEAAKVRVAAPPPAVALRVGGLGVTQGSARFNMRPLPGVKEELYRIVSEGPRKGLMPGVTFLDDAFTEARLQELVDGEFPLLHVASHFRFQPGNERDSFLLLGNERRLTLEQVRRMDLSLGRVDTLTLSACETAVSEGHTAQGAEIEGLGVLLLNQGARNVVATLWQVADQSTAELMFEFYRKRTEYPDWPKTRLLRAAQLALMRPADGAGRRGRGADYSDPYFWAPFVLMGWGQ